MKTIVITIAEDMISRIDRLVSKRGPASNRSRVIREAIRDYLARAERQADEEREGEIFRRNKAKLARQAAALVKEQPKL